MNTLEFSSLEGTNVRLEHFRAIVAGYTGRDPAAVQKHIDELASIGVPPPPEVPMFYEVDPELFSTAHEFRRQEASDTSGEVEPLFVRHNGVFYLGIGSDHTDRKLEAEDIGASKRACPKPVAPMVLPIGTIESLDLDSAWAEMYVDAEIYQQGTLAAILPPGEIISRLLGSLDIGASDFVCLGGTLPLISGKFIDGDDWEMRLSLKNGTRIEHHYIMKGTQR